MTPLARLLAFPALVLTSLAATAAPVRYALDPVHTRVLFAVEHAGFSKALGTVSGSSGTLVFDPDDWAAATLEVTVPLRRADLGDAKWNEATLARNLLDAERFPDAHFVSTKVEASDATHAKVTGNLTLHGVTRPVTLDVTLNALKRHPLPPFRRTAGFSATATLSRAAFGVDAWKSMIGDTVELRIEAEAVREGRADDDAGKTTDPAAPEQPAPATTDPESGR
ncbi:polyisoprenoid-binding protein [Xanthomonas campestris pv. incanae]|uniref:YceI family protein n=1 Tax=Xanthomonas campestris TaxID=339 RepID=UPI002367DDC8|nr:YceI family protein [Xanthomonas campestris]MEA9731014.1 YceI family protein [Xanthomonas campestris]WDJ84043.1 polyisoprenoid-binding protein [Xanthomonas campestris pv. incanae]WDJ97027.1 polyisoprenoid-binding protein [Xanthomonas campestris pv. incanae]WDK26859.1 polyisoprenoid-binding protein [Xanthomonas campestris pv. incanae]